MHVPYLFIYRVGVCMQGRSGRANEGLSGVERWTYVCMYVCMYVVSHSQVSEAQRSRVREVGRWC